MALDLPPGQSGGPVGSSAGRQPATASRASALPIGLGLGVVALVAWLALPSRSASRPDGAAGADSATPPATAVGVGAVPASPGAAGPSDVGAEGAAASGEPAPPPGGWGSPVVPGGDTPPNGDFLWLFDISGSVHQAARTAGAAERPARGGPNDDTPFARSVETLLPAMRALRTMEEVMPARFRVGTIGSLSLQQRPTCDISVAEGTLFTARDTMRVTRAMNACSGALRGLPKEPFTDIRGALAYGSLALQGQRPALRGILLYSDLVEDLPREQTPATPDLRGLCVAVYAQVTPEAALDAGAFVARQQEWRQRLLSWGARDVLARTTVGFDTNDLVTFFRGCAPR